MKREWLATFRGHGASSSLHEANQISIRLRSEIGTRKSEIGGLEAIWLPVRLSPRYLKAPIIQEIRPYKYLQHAR
jgi:hypothetical protein